MSEKWYAEIMRKELGITGNDHWFYKSKNGYRCVACDAKKEAHYHKFECPTHPPRSEYYAVGNCNCFSCFMFYERPKAVNWNSPDLRIDLLVALLKNGDEKQVEIATEYIIKA